MYRLDVTKAPVSDYVVSVSKEGSCVEDHFSLKEDGAHCLIAECKSIIKTGHPGNTTNDSGVGLDKYGNVYQLVVHVSDNFVRSYVLTETEVKLFQASLKRAVDG